MWLNFMLVAAYFIVLGVVVHRITGSGGGLLHLLFVGCGGYLLSQVCRDIAGGNIGPVWIVAADLAGAWIMETILHRVQANLLARKRRDADD